MPRAIVVVLLSLTACHDDPPRPRSTPSSPTVPKAEDAPPGVAAPPTVTVSGLAAPGCPAVPRPTGSAGLDLALTRSAQTLLSCCDAAGVGATHGPLGWTLTVVGGVATPDGTPTGAERYDPLLVECHRRKIARWDLSAAADGTYTITFDPT